MDHIKVLKRAWQNVTSYRALWIFGIILALTTTSWEASNMYSRGGSEGDSRTLQFTPPGDVQEGLEELGEFFSEVFTPEVVGTILAIGIGLACMGVVLFVVTKIARYVSEAALIRMVHEREETGDAQSARQGLRLGWSRTAWRLFLIDLVIDVPLALIAIGLLVLPLVPLLMWLFGNEFSGFIGTIAAVGFFFLSIFVLIIVAAVVSLLKKIMRRACAVEDLGVTDSIRRGYAVVRGNLKDVGLMWLIMVGLSLGYRILMVPVGLLLIGAGAVLGGLPGLAVGGLAGLVSGEPVAVLLGLAVGVPIFILVLAVPLAFLGGLFEVFQSSTWTLTYRELQAVEGLAETEVPETV